MQAIEYIQSPKQHGTKAIKNNIESKSSTENLKSETDATLAPITTVVSEMISVEKAGSTQVAGRQVKF